MQIDDQELIIARRRQTLYSQGDELILKKTIVKSLNAFLGFGMILIMLSVINLFVLKTMKLPQTFIVPPIGTLLTTILAVSYTYRKKKLVEKQIDNLELSFIKKGYGEIPHKSGNMDAKSLSEHTVN